MARRQAARRILKSHDSEVFSRFFLMNFPLKSVYRNKHEHEHDPALYKMFPRLANPQKRGEFSTSGCIGKYNVGIYGRTVATAAAAAVYLWDTRLSR